MTSTTSKVIPHVITAYLTMIVLALVVGCLQGCAEPQQVPAPTAERHHGFPAQPRETTSTQAETQESPKQPPPASNATPADKSDDDKEPPFYGSTYWDELLTSVYYYPKGPVLPSQTHLKFNHREDDIYLCGDQRKSFEPGNRYRLTVTFEPNAPCITNWRVK